MHRSRRSSRNLLEQRQRVLDALREDIVGKDWIPGPLRPVVGHIVGGMEDFVVRRIDQVVAATPHIAESFQSQAQRVVTINNYPLEDEFASSARTSSGPREGICYVGAISFVRGPTARPR